MPPVTEPLTVVGARVARGLPPLVPTLCGIAVAGSWVAGCLAIVVQH